MASLFPKSQPENRRVQTTTEWVVPCPSGPSAVPGEAQDMLTIAWSVGCYSGRYSGG